MHQINSLKEQKQINDLIDALRQLMGVWADKDGVSVAYNKQARSYIMLKLKTPDGFVIEVTYDLNKTSQEYIDNMVHGVRQHLLNERQERHKNPMIVNTGSKRAH